MLDLVMRLAAICPQIQAWREPHWPSDISKRAPGCTCRCTAALFVMWLLRDTFEVANLPRLVEILPTPGQRPRAHLGRPPRTTRFSLSPTQTATAHTEARQVRALLDKLTVPQVLDTTAYSRPENKMHLKIVTAFIQLRCLES